MLIDGRIELDDVAQEAGYHIGTITKMLMDAGLKHADAEGYAHFAISDDTEDLTDDQWDRMTLADGGNGR